MTFHWKWPRSKDCKPSTCFRIAKGWSKPSALRCEKTAVGCIFKQLLGCPALGPTDNKMQILPSKSIIQVNTHGVTPQFPRNFHRDLCSLDLSYRENLMEQMFGCWFSFSFDCEALPYGHSLRGICNWKMTCKQALSSRVWLQHTKWWESYLHSSKENQQRVCFQASIYQELFSF